MFPFTFKRKALCWCITLNSCCLLFLLGCFIKPTKACQDKQSGAYRNRCTVSASCLDRPAVFCSQNSVLHCRNLLQSSVRVCFFCLQAPDEAALSGLSESLTQAGVSHKLWIEQPENIPTCLALKPYPKETVQPLMRKFKLFKWLPLQTPPPRWDTLHPDTRFYFKLQSAKWTVGTAPFSVQN